MIVMLTFTNRLPVPIELLSNMGTGQPIQAGQSIEMTFELQEGADGVGDLILTCEPGEGRGVTEYYFDSDPAAGTWETFEFDEDTGNVTIRKYADVQPPLDYNKSFHLDSDGKGKEMWLAASIPEVIALQWLNDYGVNAWRADHWPAVKRLLEDPEWKHLRPTSFRL